MPKDPRLSQKLLRRLNQSLRPSPQLLLLLLLLLQLLLVQMAWRP
jgi:hypothetical protein